MKLNEKIIKLRKANNLSQEEFGERINVSRQAVSKWESEQSIPDIAKIKDIAKEFNLSFDYLLNDNINDELYNLFVKSDNNNNNNNNFKLSNEENNKRKAKKILKILLILLIIYLLIFIYKFAVLTRFYLVANSFSEKNQMIFVGINENDENKYNYSTYKIEDIIRTDYFSNDYNEETGEYITNIYSIDYIDLTKKEAYTFNYDKKDKKYHYYSMISSYTEKEKEDFFNSYENPIRNATLSQIPSNFKKIFLDSLNPFCRIYIFNREIRYQTPRYTFSKVLTSDGLINYLDAKVEFKNPFSYTYSYDYVQDHFTNPIKSPFDEFKDNLIYEDI